MDELYWETAGAAKTFTHPLHPEWLAGMGRSARVLDYGCGYGRVMAELGHHGFEDVLGVDISAALIERGRRSGRAWGSTSSGRRRRSAGRPAASIWWCCSRCSRACRGTKPSAR
jgi:SAM-dependent methyltransferase